MKAILLLMLAAGAQPWDEAPSVPPQWVGPSRVQPKAAIRRIVTVAPSVTETLFALGLESRVVGVSRFDDRPPRVAKLPKVGGFSDPNVEAILALRPDVVIAAANAANRPALERISELGIPVYAVPGNTFADVFHSTRALGDLLGERAAAERVLATMQREIAAVVREAQGRKTKVLVAFGLDPLVAGGSGSLVDTVLTLLGAHNAAPKGARPYPHLSAEALIEAQPDVIIDATGAHGRTRQPPWRGLDSIPAVKEGRVRALPLAVLLRPSPRIAEGVRALAEAIRK